MVGREAWRRAYDPWAQNLVQGRQVGSRPPGPGTRAHLPRAILQLEAESCSGALGFHQVRAVLPLSTDPWR